MKKLRSILNTVLNTLAGVSFIAMVILTCWQVFTRYVLKNPSTWSEELVSYLFAWASLLGASLITGERGHMNIPVVVDRFGDKTKKVFHCLAEIIGFVFSAAILVYGGIQISQLALGQTTSSLWGLAVGVFYFVMPVCGVINMIYTALNIIDIVNGTTEKEEV